MPSCRELKNRGIPEIVKKNNDYFFVYSSDHDFYVFGVNIEPDKPPQIHWWGGGAEEILKDCVDKDVEKSQ